MSPELQKQISKLKKSEWVNLHGLIDCATTYLASSLELPDLSCDSISFLGRGTYNTVYKLEFSDNSRLAASVSNLDEEYFDPEAKRSEIETMKYVRESGLYPDIPVPKIFALEANFTNLVCAPYVLMELIPGRALADDLRELTRTQQISYVKSIARLQASLSKPVPFDQIGSIKVCDGQHVVGPLMTLTQKCLGGPYKSMEDLWRAELEDQMSDALRKWCNVETDFLAPQYCSPLCTPQMFAELFQLLSSLIPHFQPPKSYLPLVLHHPDIAFRNILVDESSISSGELKITGLIDWGGAQILPLMFTAKYPDDLRTIGYYPFTRPGWEKNEDWYTVPCDWTAAGDSSQWPIAYGSGPGSGPGLIDYGPKVHGVISKFYLRAYFNACYAEEMCALHGDTDLARATVFRDATYYMKFHEVVCTGWRNWVRHKTWIRETYWRLRTAGHGIGSEGLITGPNIYTESVQEPVRDLSVYGEYPVAIVYDEDPMTSEIVPVAYHV
ncbi:hypothetical protein C0993_005419 [Termitomyces sp. T159_Od127]|nr:hypothetical protein C0993_005419 [Termitomyces sp. T159_Od127]